MAHPNQDLILRGYEAFGKGDIPAVLSLFADDVVVHVSGRSPLSGEYKGHQQVLDFINKLGQMSGGSFKMDIHDSLATDDHVVVLTKWSAEHGGRSRTGDEADVWHVANGKVTELWILSTDPFGDSEFWST
jgi:ketosteroid isomerase-like protein